MKTMAEVLAKHRISPDFECECGTDFYPQAEDLDAPDAAPDAFELAFESHQAAALSAAGFGLVADAKAEALEETVDDFSVNLTVMSGPRIRAWLSSKAAAARCGR